MHLYHIVQQAFCFLISARHKVVSYNGRGCLEVQKAVTSGGLQKSK